MRYEGHWRRRGFVAFLLSAVSFVPSAGFPQSALITLSDHDPRYRRMAEIQKSFCEDKPTHRCDVDKDDCLANFDIPNVEPRGTEQTRLIQEICSVRGTPYEITGLHWLLQQRLKKLRAAAGQIGVALPQDILLGALPLKDVGAEVAGRTEESDAVVLLNVRFVQFAVMVSDLAFRMVPHQPVSDGIQSFDLSREGVERHLLEHPEFSERLFEILDLYRTDKPLENDFKDLPVGKYLSDLLTPDYALAIEAFAIAHEIGHVYYEHGPSSLNLAELSEMAAKFFAWKGTSVHEAIAELEADVFALRLINQLGISALEEEGENSPGGCALSAVRVFFVAKRILGESAINAVRSEPDGPPDVGTAKDIELVKKCVMEDGCRVRDISGLSSELVSAKQHPSDNFRRQLVERIIISNIPKPLPRYLLVCETANYSLERLWEVSSDEYFSRKPWVE